MLPIFIFAMLGFSMILIGADQDESEEGDTDEPKVKPQGNTFAVAPGETVEGTDANDFFNLVDGADYGFAPDTDTRISVAAAGGDDVIDLTLAGPDLIGNVDGGSGDDTISVVSSSATITGGSGDDDIDFQGQDAAIYGGDGNDDIYTSGIGLSVYGGAGDDILDGRDAQDAVLYGNEGDDTLLISGYGSNGAAYYLNAYGGEGDDTLVFEGVPRPDDEALVTATLTGGSGTDRFEVSFDETVTMESAGNADNPEVWDVVTLGDFVSGEDMIVIETVIANPNFAISSARLVEDAELSETRVIVTYENATEDDREFAVVINAVDITWDDISFVGDHIPSVLQPIA